jgi:hypothetical protein
MKRIIGMVAVVTLLLGLAGVVQVARPPKAEAAADSLSHCDTIVAINNNSGELDLTVCLRHITGSPHGYYQSYSSWACYAPGSGLGGGGATLQSCNIGADSQRMWYNATLVDDIVPSGIGILNGTAVFNIFGHPHSCTSASISVVVINPKVRFAGDGILWRIDLSESTGGIGGSLSC